MNLTRSNVGVVLIALLAVVGVGLMASTVTSTYSTDYAPGQGQDQDPDSGPGSDPGDAGGIDQDMAGEAGAGQQPIDIPEICIEILTQLPAIIGLILGFLLLVSLTYRQRGFIAAGFVGYLFGIPLVLGYGLVTQCGSGLAGPGDEGGGPLAIVQDLAGAAGGTPVPPVVFAGVFVLAAVVAIAVIASASGSQEIDAEEWVEEEEPNLEDFAAVAGEAADRIESTDASVDNAVYRAWLDMTNLLDLSDPDTSTPGEFADAAVEVGLDEDDVSDLTRLFEEVRYGDMDPGPREDLALETLRNIEGSYDADETDDDASSDATDADGGDE